MLLDKRCDEEVAVVVSRLHAQRQRLPFAFARAAEIFGHQLVDGTREGVAAPKLYFFAMFALNFCDLYCSMLKGEPIILNSS